METSIQDKILFTQLTAKVLRKLHCNCNIRNQESASPYRAIFLEKKSKVKISF